MSSWLDVGSRVATARKAASLTQEDLANAAGLDRTAISRIESGQRALDALELGRLARVLGRSVAWFLTTPAQALISRRAALPHRAPHPSDALLEEIAQAVELLLELKVLRMDAFRATGAVRDFNDAEGAATDTRARLGQGDGPLWGLARVAEELGLSAFSLDLGDGELDGAYASLEPGGVAIINGRLEAGRRRFTLAHEIGHHVLQDEYASDWDIMQGAEERERLINAFAIHFLMPRRGVTQHWRELDGASDPWRAALHLGVRFGVSWTALCLHLRNLHVIEQRVVDTLSARPPVRADYLEHELAIREDLVPPEVPPRYAAAVVKAYRTQRVSAHRTVELLHGAVKADDLPPVDTLPIEALRSELKSVP